MAYLKGGSVVDGNLYVEGDLKVKAVENQDGSEYLVIDKGDSLINSYAKIKNTKGQVTSSALLEQVDGGNIILCPSETVYNSLQIGEGFNIVKLNMYSNLIPKLSDGQDTTMDNDEVAYWSYNNDPTLVLPLLANKYTIPAEMIESGTSVVLQGRENN